MPSMRAVVAGLVVVAGLALTMMFGPAGSYKNRVPIPQQQEQVQQRQQNQAAASASRASAQIPDRALQVLATIRNTGHGPSGYRGGTMYSNDGRGGGEVLPRAAADGQRVSYKEWDVNPYQRGINRGAERLVTGSDGRAYYTSDHYRTFVEVH